MSSDSIAFETLPGFSEVASGDSEAKTKKKLSRGGRLSRSKIRSLGRPHPQRRAAEQAGKMEAMGQLAGGIAHDFNNLLTVILGHSEFLLKRDESKESSRARVEEIRKAAERGAWLTNQLLAYSRNQILEPAVFQMNSVLEDMDGVLRCVLGEDVALDLVMDPALGWAKMDCGQLQQIVLNLAANARDAMPRGGRLRLETFNRTVSANASRNEKFVAPGEYVALVAEDTGAGIEPAIRTRIFEPFFTTKEKGKGTGLGLATVSRIVKQSGGFIWAESQVGAGSAFHILLPRVASGDGRADPQKMPEFHVSGGTVLVVEDDPAVRRTAVEILRRSGYRVLAAPSGGDAVRIAGTQKRRLDLLVTDVVMPDMTGPELASHCSLTSPGLQILYMSGYTDDAIENHGAGGPSVRLLQKPFTHESLMRAVREALK